MTELRVVADNTIELQVYNPKIIPSIARAFADKAEAGELGAITQAIVLVENEDGVTRLYWGEQPQHSEILAMLQIALTQATQAAIDSYADA
jgi:hypothetical protein